MSDLHLTIYYDVRECHHSTTADLEALRSELSEDYRIADFVARAKCSKCGPKWPKLSVKVGVIHTGGMRGKV